MYLVAGLFLFSRASPGACLASFSGTGASSDQFCNRVFARHRHLLLDVIEKDVESMVELHLPSPPVQCGQQLIDLDGTPWLLPCQKLIQPCHAQGLSEDVCAEPL